MGTPCRTAVQLGMSPQAVQTKIDYLIVCPLLYRQCLPTLSALLNEVTFSIFENLSLPSLRAVGCASRACSQSVFEDDILWWRVLVSLPSSGQRVEEAMAAQKRGE